MQKRILISNLKPLRRTSQCTTIVPMEAKHTPPTRRKSSILNKNDSNKLIKEVISSTWQGVLSNTRYNDPTLVLDKCLNWLTSWKDCSVEIVNDFQSIYLQTVPTATFRKHRGHPNMSTVCRLCNGGNESVKHLLSNCTKFVSHQYKRRHDRVLQSIVFNYLMKNKITTNCPPQYSMVEI